MTRTLLGVEAVEVIVEVHLFNGLPKVNIVGMPETAVRESRDRVRSALLTSNLEFPAKVVVINLAPAEMPKSGGRFDLAIALGIIQASEQLPENALNEYELLGELALSGELRPVRGAMPAALACRDNHRKLIVPSANASEAALVQGVEILGADHLLQVVAHLRGEKIITPQAPTPLDEETSNYQDMTDIKGQQQAKRALEIAAAGGHSLLLTGPPGTGKTMLAQRLPGLLPPLSEEEILEVAAVYSVNRAHDQTPRPVYRQRPFRSPHHSATAPALIGGGSVLPSPGEVSLAHNGVLFLDELPEFQKRVLESLREPLESGEVHIARARYRVCYPANFQLIMAMNPCPAGGCGDGIPCRCAPGDAERYQAKLSGPFLDRIDMHIWVPRLHRGELRGASGESSQRIRQRVIASLATQLKRSGKRNATLTPGEIERWCALPDTNWQQLEAAAERTGLSARAVHRMLRVARTIADLDNAEQVNRNHWEEAMSYRPRLDHGTPKQQRG